MNPLNIGFPTASGCCQYYANCFESLACSCELRNLNYLSLSQCPYDVVDRSLIDRLDVQFIHDFRWPDTAQRRFGRL